MWRKNRFFVSVFAFFTCKVWGGGGVEEEGLKGKGLKIRRIRSDWEERIGARKRFTKMCFFSLIFSPFSLPFAIADSDFFLPCHYLSSLFSISPLFNFINFINIPLFTFVLMLASSPMKSSQRLCFRFCHLSCCWHLCFCWCTLYCQRPFLFLAFLALLSFPLLHGAVNAVSCITVLLQGPCYGWLPCC